MIGVWSEQKIDSKCSVTHAKTHTHIGEECEPESEQLTSDKKPEVRKSTIYRSLTKNGMQKC